MTTSVPIGIGWDNLDNLFANYGKPVDGIYTGPAIVNDISVVIADSNAGTGDTLSGYRTTDDDSVAQYGQQAGRLLVTLLATTSDAQALAEYLQIPAPVYWFSGIQIPFNALTGPQRDVVALLDIGSQVIVSKRFPNVAAPVIEELAVEGIDHAITPKDGHIVTIWTSPTTLYLNFQLDISDLDNPAYGLG